MGLGLPQFVVTQNPWSWRVIGLHFVLFFQLSTSAGLKQKPTHHVLLLSWTRVVDDALAGFTFISPSHSLSPLYFPSLVICNPSYCLSRPSVSDGEGDSRTHRRLCDVGDRGPEHGFHWGHTANQGLWKDRLPAG